MLLSRRQLFALALASGAGLLTRQADAIGPQSLFRFGQLQLGQGWNPRPEALVRMGRQLEHRTSIEVDTQPAVIALDQVDDGRVSRRRGRRRRRRRGDDARSGSRSRSRSRSAAGRGEQQGLNLHATPFLYLAGNREFAIPPQRQVDILHQHLTFGGFLLIDSAEGSVDGAFDRSVRRLIGALFPQPAKGLEIIPSDHVVYKSFYLLDRPYGRLLISPVMEGILRDGRLMVAYTHNDIGGAFARDGFGNYEFQCVPDGERQRERAYRMLVNIVMYALCLDYKTDQVHVPFIMRRRRWRANEGGETLRLPEDGDGSGVSPNERGRRSP